MIRVNANKQFYSLALKFRKVVRQQISGEAADCISVFFFFGSFENAETKEYC